MSTCAKCGTDVQESANFCPSCGAPILHASAPRPPAPPPRPAAFDDLIGRPSQPKPVVSEKRGSFPVAAVLAAAALVFCGLLLFFMMRWDQQQTAGMAAIEKRLASIDGSLGVVDRRLTQGDQKVASLQSETQVMRERLGLTAAELQRAQALAKRLQDEQARSVAVLHNQLATKADTEKVETLKKESETKLAGVSEDITEVREEVKTGQEELQKTKAELARLGVLVTDQGNMIATGAAGLDELRKKGEREFFTFDVRKRKRENLAGIGLELRKADVGKQYVDLRLYVDDRRTDHKQIFVNRPVTFYAGRNRALYEVVVNEVRKDQMIGYVSIPKYPIPASAAK